ncbi:MAG: iron ABC transporter permease [Gemmatimonadales bacterium]|jgi:iron(III) transport system permease protein
MTRGRTRPALAWERRHTAALAVPVALLLVWLVLYPNLLVLAESVREEGRLTLAHYADFFATRAELAALWASIWISLASVALSALIGVPLAMFFHRFEFPGRRVFAALAALPVLLPPLVGVIAFLFLVGESGILTRGVQLALGLEAAPWRLAGAPAILFVHAYTMYVYFYLFTLAGLARMDAGITEAAASLGAGRWRILRTVTLPLLVPSLTAAALLVFMTSMASFSAPYVFGGGFRVLTTQIYASKISGELPMAMVETVILALASLVALWFLRRYEEAREYVVVGKGVAPARRRVRSPGARALLAAAGAGWVLLLLLPHLTLVLISFVPDGGWTTQLLPERYALENYRGLLRDPRLLAPILNSLQMAALATAANLVFCFVAAYLVVRRSFRGRAWLAVLLVLPWALPGTVIAIGLATTFSANQPWVGRFVLVGTFWILPLAYFIRNIPLVAQAAIAAFRRFDPRLEEAAASLGAGWITTMRRVALPLVTPGLAAGGLLAFVTALGEFVASILLYTPRSRPISIEILAQLRAFDFGGAAALGVVLALLMAIVFVIGGRFVREGVGTPGG